MDKCPYAERKCDIILVSTQKVNTKQTDLHYYCRTHERSFFISTVKESVNLEELEI